MEDREPTSTFSIQSQATLQSGETLDPSQEYREIIRELQENAETTHGDTTPSTQSATIGDTACRCQVGRVKIKVAKYACAVVIGAVVTLGTLYLSGGTEN